MYDTLLRMYLAGSLDEDGLDRAVTKGWITEEQKQQILSAKA